MARVKVSVVIAIVVLAAVVAYIVNKSSQASELPKLSLKYWGPGKEKPDDKSIKPFKISFPSSELHELKEKLEKTRSFTPPLEDVAFEYGFNTIYLNFLLEFWKTKYNWTEREDYLNSLPQFKTQVGGLDIHFIHVKPDSAEAKGKKVLPLMMVHGWPGSIREFYDIIPLLTTPRPDADFVFEVVAPSIPGFAFSQAPSKAGLAPAYIGLIFNELMNRLGHSKYYYQGGDWGSIIGHTLSIISPEKILAYHSNLCIVQNLKGRILSGLAYLFPKLFIEQSLQQQYVSQFLDIYLVETGYFHIQATKPDTVGVALTDSPAGLAAYILEKFSTGTNKNWRSLPDGGLENLNKVDILDNVMIYWLTKTITSSMRLYKEYYSRKYLSLGIMNHQNKVPTACAVFKHEILYYPKIVLESVHKNLVQMNHFMKGGHFAAFEEPKLLSDDVWMFVKTIRKPVLGNQ